MEFKRTDGTNKDFVENCRLLDQDLDRRVGREIQREKCNAYSQLDHIHEAIGVYEGDTPVGGGAIRRYSETDVELKRIFVRPEYQGQGNLWWCPLKARRSLRRTTGKGSYMQIST